MFDTLSMQEDDEDIFMPTIDLIVNELNLNVNHLNLLSNDSGVIPSTSNQTVATAVSNARFATLSNQELNNIVTNAYSRNTKANTKWNMIDIAMRVHQLYFCEFLAMLLMYKTL